MKNFRLIFRIFISIILLVLTILIVSLYLKITFIYLFYLLNRKFINSRHKPLVNKISFGLFVLSIIWLFPTLKSDKDDYIQSVYYNVRTGEQVSTPLLSYLTNVLGEGDIMLFIALISKVTPDYFIQNRTAINDVLRYCKRTPLFENNLYYPYVKLEFKSRPGHNVPFQILKGLGLYKNINHYFISKPKSIDENTEVIVFAHGYAGNWLLYPQLISQYTDAIIISVETPNFIGYFDNMTIKNIINNDLDHAYKRLGLKNKKPHLVGLSNGGSAVNNSMKSFSNYFKSFTIISASLRSITTQNKTVNIIYGIKDRSGGYSKDIPISKYKKYVVKNEDHSLFVSKPSIIFDIICGTIN